MIKNSIRNSNPSDKGHITVYLPSYSDQRIIQVISKIESVKWQVFSKRIKSHADIKNITIYPADQKTFNESIITSGGVICGAGFETPAEALHLGKKLIAIPMRHQYEQQCNAAALEQMGILILDRLDSSSIERIKKWINEGKVIKKEYHSTPQEVVNTLVDNFVAINQSSYKNVLI